MKKTTFLVLLMSTTLFLFSQGVPTLLDSTNTFIRTKAILVNSLGMIYYKCDSLAPCSLFTSYKQYTGLGANDSMVLVKKWQDSQTLGTHYKYQQYYKGILVEGAEYREHCADSDYVSVGDGILLENFEHSGNPVIPDSVALDSALISINAEEYAWENDSANYFLSLDSNSSTYYPTGTLVYTILKDSTENDIIIPSKYSLAWKFNIILIDSFSYFESYTVYINATTAETMKIVSGSTHSDFTHIYYGLNYLDTRWYGGLKRKHFLIADDNGRNIKTRHGKRTNNYTHSAWSYDNLPADADGHFGTDHWPETASHYVTHLTWTMFKDKYGRQGLDDKGKELRVWVTDDGRHDGAAFENNFSNGTADYIMVSYDNGLCATFDVLGHELAHGIIHLCGAELTNTNETGSLNESFADIFGFINERYWLQDWNWAIGDKTTPNYRLMSSPNSVSPPTTSSSCSKPLPLAYPVNYLGSDWYTGTCDAGGVHFNCMPQDLAFYFLCNGGSQNGINVTGIGIDKAAIIFWYSMTNNIRSNETYALSRMHAIDAAIRLFGNCSQEHLQTCRAFAAINVGQICEPCGILMSPCNEYENWGEIRVKNEKIERRSEKDIEIYPNPTDEMLNINLNGIPITERSNIKIEILSVDGKVVFNEITQNEDDIYKLSTSNLNHGIYLMKITSSNGWIKTFRFVRN